MEDEIWEVGQGPLESSSLRGLLDFILSEILGVSTFLLIKFVASSLFFVVVVRLSYLL